MSERKQTLRLLALAERKLDKDRFSALKNRSSLSDVWPLSQYQRGPQCKVKKNKVVDWRRCNVGDSLARITVGEYKRAPAYGHAHLKRMASWDGAFTCHRWLYK